MEKSEMCMPVYTVVYVMLVLINFIGDYCNNDGCVCNLIWTSKVDILFIFSEPCWVLVLRSMSWTVSTVTLLLCWSDCVLYCGSTAASNKWECCQAAHYRNGCVPSELHVPNAIHTFPVWVYGWTIGTASGWCWKVTLQLKLQ
jgi:hypothetical protein